MDAAQRATKLVNSWVKDAQGLPITVSINRLGLAIAEAFADLEREAYERGLRTAVEFQDQEPDQQIRALAGFANQAGARGIFLIRGATNLDFVCNLPGADLPIWSNFEDARLFLVARFPNGDGGEPGIEYLGGEENDHS